MTGGYYVYEVALAMPIGIDWSKTGRLFKTTAFVSRDDMW